VRALLPSTTGEPDLDSIYGLPRLDGAGSHLRCNFVDSLDGAIEVDGRSGALGGPGDERIFSLLRELTDVVLVGAGTARTEGYGPVRLPLTRRRKRVAVGQAAVPPIAVVTASGLAPDSRLLEPIDGSPAPLVLTTAQVAESADERVRERAEVVPCGTTGVDLEVAIRALAARGLRRVLCEGGPRLFTDLAALGLVDELCLTLAPQLAGPDRARMTSGASWTAPHGLTLSSVLEQDGELYLRYTRGG
jgi:riboflavin biosynthesis pyrimidine reductase